MAISNRVKRNISFCLTILGCVIIIARVLGPILTGHIDARGCFDIFGACVITYLAFDNFRIYSRRVKKNIRSGS